MAKGIRYSEEFKHEAVNQVVHRNYPVAEVLAAEIVEQLEAALGEFREVESLLS